MVEFRACPLERRKSQTSIGSIAPNAGRRWMEGTKVNESAADWGLAFDTLLLIAFLQSDAETQEAAAEKFAKKLLDIPENVDLFAETPEERRARSDKWYAQEWEKIKQEIEEMKISEATRPENPASGCCRESWGAF